MGLRRINVDGLDKVLSLIEELKKEGGKIFILFCGSSDPVTGHSWCSDCVKAEPVIDKVAFEAKGGVLITCTVGDRPTWKDPSNIYRTTPNIKLTGVPTLMQWGTAKRLGPEECANEDLVRLILFEDDD